MGGYAGIAAGFISLMISAALLPNIPSSLVAFVVSIAISIIVSLTTKRFNAPKPLTDNENVPMDSSNRLGTLPLVGKTRLD